MSLQIELTPEQQERHEKWGWEYYYEPSTNKMEFSQVRTNMMEDVNYVPYCMNSGCQRYSKTNVIGTLKCSRCDHEITYPKDFIDKFKAKHNL